MHFTWSSADIGVSVCIGMVFLHWPAVPDFLMDFLGLISVCMQIFSVTAGMQIWGFLFFALHTEPIVWHFFANFWMLLCFGLFLWWSLFKCTHPLLQWILHIHICTCHLNTIPPQNSALVKKLYWLFKEQTTSKQSRWC